MQKYFHNTKYYKYMYLNLSNIDNLFITTYSNKKQIKKNTCSLFKVNKPHVVNNWICVYT